MASNKPTTTTADKPAPPAAPSNIIEFVPFGAKDKIQLTLEIVKRLVATRTKQGRTCSDDDALKFMLMCQARHLNPFEGDAFLVGYDTQDGPRFSLITAHQAFLKRAEVHQEFDGMDSGTIVMRNGEVIDLVGDWHMPNDTVLGGWATVYFKNRKYPMKKRLRLARFNKGFGVWKDDPGGMIVKCAEADALRSSFPTMLGGMFIEQEVETIRAEEVARPVFDAAGALPAGEQQQPTKTTESAAPTPTKAPEPTKPPQPAKAPEPTKPAQPAAPQQPEKKASAPAAAPTLQRKSPAAASTSSATTSTPAASTTSPSDREKLKAMLAAGGFSEMAFVAAAINEGWIDAEVGTFASIPEGRFAEFVKPDNWSLVQEVLEERAKAQGLRDPQQPPPGQLL